MFELENFFCFPKRGMFWLRIYFEIYSFPIADSKEKFSGNSRKSVFNKLTNVT